jgi:hypothetical protein
MLNGLRSILNQARTTMRIEDKQTRDLIRKGEITGSYYEKKGWEEAELMFSLTTPIRYFSYVAEVIKQD